MGRPQGGGGPAARIQQPRSGHIDPFVCCVTREPLSAFPKPQCFRQDVSGRGRLDDILGLEPLRKESFLGLQMGKQTPAPSLGQPRSVQRGE